MLDFVTNLIGDAQITNAQGKESDVCQKAIFLNRVFAEVFEAFWFLRF